MLVKIKNRILNFDKVLVIQFFEYNDISPKIKVVLEGGLIQEFTGEEVNTVKNYINQMNVYTPK